MEASTNSGGELAAYLASLERDACYRVDAVYKDGRYERTERVFFVGENGAELGPFVRKLLVADAGLGGAYETLLEAQRAGARFAHLPRIVECHRGDARLVVVMEHVEGETLAECVGRVDGAAGRLDLARRVFPELCDAVSELHERIEPPLIHRDLKPSNVMVSKAGVTLIDLGIARTFKEGAERDTVRFGTRAYAPPEQFGFGQTGVTSDVYALGMLLFFCFAGREPTTRDREEGFAGTGVPDALRAVVRHATELDPAARYGSARELRAAFLAALPRVGDASAGEKDARSADAPPTSFDHPRGRVARALPAEGGAGPLSRVPAWVGVVWNTVVLLVCAVLVVGCVMAVVDPTPENAAWPAWYLAWSYFAFMVPEIVIAAYLLLDRRPVRRAIPPLARLTVGRELRVGLLAMLALLAAWIVATAVMQAG